MPWDPSNAFTSIRRWEHAEGPRLVGAGYQMNTSFTNPVKVWTDRYAGNLVIQGTGTYTDWEGRHFSVGPGSFVHHLPGRYHHIERGAEGWVEYGVILDPGLVAHFMALGFLDSDLPVFSTGAPRTLCEQFHRLANELEHAPIHALPGCVLAAGEILLNARQACQRMTVETHEGAFLRTVRERLGRDLTAQLSLDGLAYEAGFSTPHFRRVFIAAFGEPPGAYRNRCRMEQAQLLLAHGQLRVGAVAARLGYSDQFVFCRQFKKHFGVPPKSYQLHHRID